MGHTVAAGHHNRAGNRMEAASTGLRRRIAEDEDGAIDGASTAEVGHLGSTDLLVRGPQPARAARAVRDPRLRRRLVQADVVAGCASGAVTAIVAGLPLASLPLLALAIAVVWPVVAGACGLYTVSPLRTWASGLGEAPRLAVSGLLISWPAFGLLGAFAAARPVSGALAASALVASSAALARSGARAAIHRTAALRQRTVILGSGTVAADLIARLHKYPELGLDPVGFLDDDVHEPLALGLPRLGGLDALPALIAQGRVDRVMIAFTRSRHEELLHCVRLCRDAGVTVDIVPRLFEFLDGARYVEQIGDIPLVSIQVPEFTRLSRVAKRGLDIAMASVLLIALLPLTVAIAVAIKLDSRGPVLFVQPRIGRGGRLFRLLKFRSMRVGSRVLVREDGAIVKGPEDHRVTRVGRVLRRFSLDEAPQLLNVLRGDMSMVGPRPLVIAEAEALTHPWQSRRADLRPGLTGPWQVSGRSHIPFQEMIKLDYQYVAGWSLARDVEILLATFPAVLTGRGAI
jgi:exopolysaccharide biosynthesis polyprenyl glycosylphosphotransferase